VLHSDNVFANYTRPVEGVTPEQYVKFRRKPTRLGDAWWVAKQLYWQLAGLFVLVIAVLAYRRWRGNPPGPMDVALIGVLLMPPAYGLISRLSSWVYTYNRMVGASGWGRWQEVLDLARQLDGKVPPEELAFRRARALCGLGRSDEAFRLLKPLGDGEAMPLWMYHARLGEIYSVLKQPDQIVEHAELAVQLAPGDPTALLDLAGTLLRYRPDLPRVASLLDEVRGHAVSDMLAPILQMTDGQLYLEQGKAHQARRELEQGLERWHALGMDEQLVGPITDRGLTYLALACARLGDKTAAREHFRKAEPRLRALDHTDLLERCAQELRLEEAPVWS
jgi:tetratricopeptide (TPR) repeat protein